MDNLSTTEMKDLLYLNSRLLTLTGLVTEFKNDTKALKICITLLKYQKNTIEKRKTTLPHEEIKNIVWDLDDLIKIAKRLKSAKRAEILTKTISDLNRIKEKTETAVKTIDGKLNPVPESGGIASVIGSTAQRLSEKLEKGAQILGDAVNEKVDGLKKKITAKH